MELKQDEYLTANHISANRKKGLTKYDQDLIEKCTFTQSRCRPLAGKRKIDMETVYTSVKRPKKTVHIIARSKQNSISSRMRNGKSRRNTSLKKITFHPETDKNFNIKHKVILRSMRQKSKLLNLGKPKDEPAPPVQFKQPPVKIKVRRKSRSKLKVESVNGSSQTAPNNNNDQTGKCDGGTGCDNVLNFQINYICKDLDDLNPRTVDEPPPRTLPPHADTCVQKATKTTPKVPKNQTLSDPYSLPYEESLSPNDGKDVYEFDENEDETIQPLTRKSASSKNDSVVVNETPKSEQKNEPEEKRDYSGKLKLTLKMKKSSVLDDVLEKGNNMKSIREPQYEVLRLQVDGPVE